MICENCKNSCKQRIPVINCPKYIEKTAVRQIERQKPIIITRNKYNTITEENKGAKNRNESAKKRITQQMKETDCRKKEEQLRMVI